MNQDPLGLTRPRRKWLCIFKYAERSRRWKLASFTTRATAAAAARDYCRRIEIACQQSV